LLLGAYNGLLMPLRALYPLYALVVGSRRERPAEVRQRLGRLEPAGERPLWIQAASVGETGVAATVAKALLRDQPSLPILVTTTTRTGQDAAARALPASVARGFFPLDFPGAVRRALETVRPSALLLVETELWPNLLIEAATRRVPILIVNGRLSDRAFRRYRLAAPLFARALEGVRIACVQSPLDAERFARLGLAEAKIRVTGNVKFAASAERHDGSAMREAVGAGPSDEVWVAGSTAEGEEEAVLTAFRALPANGVRRVLVLAPRRPERFEDVGRLLASTGLAWRRRSEPDGSAVARPAAREGIPGSGLAAIGADGEATRAVLLDTMGELSPLYAAATVAFVGGTLAPIGGHNVIEPAASGVAPVFGPHIQNVRDVAARLLEAGGAFQVQDAAGLASTFARLAADPELRGRAGESARGVVEANAGALEATLREIRPFLTSSGRRSA
jgi:3-deoxy-D-manno-octulosonic-acid transferase